MPGYFLLLPIIVPILAGLAMLNIRYMSDRKVRDAYVGVVLLVCVILTGVLTFGGGNPEYRVNLPGNLLFLLRQDGFAKISGILLSVSWALTGLFSTEYKAQAENPTQYFAFYLLTGGFLTGVAYAGSLGTLRLFYILAGVACIPLINHRMTPKAVNASLFYLAYLLVGFICVQIGSGYIMKFATTREFSAGGVLTQAAIADHRGMMLFMSFLVIMGFGIRACMYPFHGWNKIVSEASPLCTTAAMSGIMTKAGIIALIRFVGQIVGLDLFEGSWVQIVIIVLAIISIFMGAILAFKNDRLEERMAYSTVGQVGCMLFGIGIFCEEAIAGTMVLMVSHTFTILALFFAVGAIYKKTTFTRASQLRGIGKQMPVMMVLFTLAALSLIGTPPTLGFVGDWNVSIGAMKSALPLLANIGSMIFIVGELLAAGYLSGMIIRGFFPGEKFSEQEFVKYYPSWRMVLPTLILVLILYLLGLYPKPLLDLVREALQGFAL